MQIIYKVVKCLKNNEILFNVSDVVAGGKTYKYFIMQSTGGGHFPNTYAHPETGLNVFKANIVPILGLEKDGLEYEILQIRSCARGITAQNAFRMAAPASNCVMVYGIGGIGMSIMAGNAILMKSAMGLRQNLSEGKISNKHFQSALSTSDFGSNTLHWTKPNPLSQNYSQFFDNVSNPRLIARRMGLRRRPAAINYGLKLLNLVSRR